LPCDREEAHALRFDLDEGEGVNAGIASAIKPVALLAPRRAADQNLDLWSITNVIQENVIKGDLHGQYRDGQNRQRRTSTRPIKGVDQNVKLNQALWRWLS